MRECTATAELDGKKQAMSWQEPVMLTGAPRFKNPCEIRVKPGDALVVPFDLVVEQGAGAARALAVDGKVEETYKPVAKHEASNPADRVVVCVLTAEVLEPVKAEWDREIPQFRGPTFELQPGKVTPNDAKPTAVKSRVRGTRPGLLKED